MKNNMAIWGVVLAAIIGVGCFMKFGGGVSLSGNTDVKKSEQQPIAQAAVSTQKNKMSDKKETEPQTTESGETIFNVRDINSSMIGRTVTVVCKVGNVKKPKNTVFFDIQDANNIKHVIKGVLFNKTNQDNEGRQPLLEECAANRNSLYINGEVSSYNGQLEIKAWKVYTK